MSPPMLPDPSLGRTVRMHGASSSSTSNSAAKDNDPMTSVITVANRSHVGRPRPTNRLPPPPPSSSSGASKAQKTGKSGNVSAPLRPGQNIPPSKVALTENDSSRGRSGGTTADGRNSETDPGSSEDYDKYETEDEREDNRNEARKDPTASKIGDFVVHEKRCAICIQKRRAVCTGLPGVACHTCRKDKTPCDYAMRNSRKKSREAREALATSPSRSLKRMRSASDDQILPARKPMKKSSPPATLPRTPAFINRAELGIRSRSLTPDDDKDSVELDALDRLGRYSEDFEDVKCLGTQTAVYKNAMARVCTSAEEVATLRKARKGKEERHLEKGRKRRRVDST